MASEAASSIWRPTCHLCYRKMDDDSPYDSLLPLELNCKDKYHAACIKLWLVTHDSCPLDGIKITSLNGEAFKCEPYKTTANQPGAVAGSPVLKRESAAKSIMLPPTPRVVCTTTLGDIESITSASFDLANPVHQLAAKVHAALSYNPEDLEWSSSDDDIYS